MTLKNSENARKDQYICRLEDVSFSLNEKKLLDFVTSERRKTIEQFYSDIDGRLSLYGGLIIWDCCSDEKKLSGDYHYMVD